MAIIWLIRENNLKIEFLKNEVNIEPDPVPESAAFSEQQEMWFGRCCRGVPRQKMFQPQVRGNMAVIHPERDARRTILRINLGKVILCGVRPLLASYFAIPWAPRE